MNLKDTYDEYKKLGKKLRELRVASDFSVVYVIKRLRKYNLHYSPQSIYKWEQGQVTPDIYVLIALSNVYKTNLSYILDENVVTTKNLTACEIFLLKKYHCDKNFRDISNLLTKRHFSNLKK